MEKPTDHHMLYYRPEWSVRREAQYLRELGGLRVDLTREDHDEIHRRIPLVPLLGLHALERVAREHKRTDSLYQNIDSFICATERALKHPKSHELERQLGALTIESIVLQRDFIKEIRGRKGVLVSGKQLRQEEL